MSKSIVWINRLLTLACAGPKPKVATSLFFFHEEKHRKMYACWCDACLSCLLALFLRCSVFVDIFDSFHYHVDAFRNVHSRLYRSPFSFTNLDSIVAFDSKWKYLYISMAQPQHRPMRNIKHNRTSGVRRVLWILGMLRAHTTPNHRTNVK